MNFFSIFRYENSAALKKNPSSGPESLSRAKGAAAANVEINSSSVSASAASSGDNDSASSSPSSSGAGLRKWAQKKQQSGKQHHYTKRTDSTKQP